MSSLRRDLVGASRAAITFGSPAFVEEARQQERHKERYRQTDKKRDRERKSASEVDKWPSDFYRFVKLRSFLLILRLQIRIATVISVNVCLFELLETLK